MNGSGNTGSELPDPLDARTLDEFGDRLHALRVWSGMTYRELHRRVVRSRRRRGLTDLPSFNTVYRCLQPGRTRLDADLVADIVQELHPEPGAARRWREACQVVVGLAAQAAVVEIRTGLPADEPRFVGRTGTIATMLAAAAAPGPTVITVDGMPGVGKTALVTRVAHLLRQRYGPADPVLTLDLRGFDIQRAPVDPSAALDGLLRLLGSPTRHGSADEMGRRYHRLLSGRRVLLILDDAAGSEQVRPLLPGTEGSVALVTSRQRLPDLPGVRIGLDVLDTDEAVQLIAGAGRADGDAAAGTARAIAELAGRLPLALALIASRMRGRPDWSLPDHLARLAENQAKLRLDDGIEFALRSSYDNLPAQHRRLLRLLSQPTGPDLDTYGAAALAGCDLVTASALIGDLHAASLLLRRAPDRYRMHDLMRVFAANRAVDEDPVQARRAALDRLYGYYAAASARAMDRCAPHERYRRPPARTTGAELPPMPDEGAATAWLDAERANLVASVMPTSAYPQPDHAPYLSQTLARYLAIGSWDHEAEILHGAAARLAAGTSRAGALISLGGVSWRLGRYQEARERFHAALETGRELGDPALVCRAYQNLSLVHGVLGQYERALREQEHAYRSCLDTGERSVEAQVLNDLGYLCERLSRYRQALEYFERAAALAAAVGDRDLADQVSGNIGFIRYRMGEYERALRDTQDHLAGALRSGRRSGEVDARNQLGLIYSALGEHRRALAEHAAALDVLRQVGRRRKEAEVLNDFGSSLTRSGDPGTALERHADALTIAEELDDRYQQARAHQGIAAAHEAGGRPDTAQPHRARAAALHDAIGLPMRDEPVVSSASTG
ncbi:tetratricopeptide repeat protein [Saccharothrix sp. BKS2]|uniref:tetratricopeptide repeat protein n=1 Tax=Saccharothrix sp. BKS2 TaxID=3064400 RepID=UPI0039EA7187